MGVVGTLRVSSQIGNLFRSRRPRMEATCHMPATEARRREWNEVALKQHLGRGLFIVEWLV